MEIGGGTEVWCPWCRGFTVCQAEGVKGIDRNNRVVRSNDLFLGGKVGYFRRSRTCRTCRQTFITVEIEEGAWRSAVRLSSLNQKVQRYLELETLATEARNALVSAIDLTVADRVEKALAFIFNRLEGVHIATAEELGGRSTSPDFELYYPSGQRYLAVKIVGPSDAFSSLIRNLEKYAQRAKHVWVIDPGLRRFSVYEAGTLKETKALQLPDFDVVIEERHIFDYPMIRPLNVV